MIIKLKLKFLFFLFLMSFSMIVSAESALNEMQIQKIEKAILEVVKNSDTIINLDDWENSMKINIINKLREITANYMSNKDYKEYTKGKLEVLVKEYVMQREKQAIEYSKTMDLTKYRLSLENYRRFLFEVYDSLSSIYKLTLENPNAAEYLYVFSITLILIVDAVAVFVAFFPSGIFVVLPQVNNLIAANAVMLSNPTGTIVNVITNNERLKYEFFKESVITNISKLDERLELLRAEVN